MNRVLVYLGTGIVRMNFEPKNRTILFQSFFTFLCSIRTLRCVHLVNFYWVEHMGNVRTCQQRLDELSLCGSCCHARDT